jgi:hypothetical protein
MWRKAGIIGIGTALLVGVLGVTAAVSEDTAPPRLRGTLDQVSGNTLTIKARNGTPTTVQLKDGASVIAGYRRGALSVGPDAEQLYDQCGGYAAGQEG